MAKIVNEMDDGQERREYVVADGWTVADTFGRLTPSGRKVLLTEEEARAHHYKLTPDPYPNEGKNAPVGAKGPTTPAPKGKTPAGDHA